MRAYRWPISDSGRERLSSVLWSAFYGLHRALPVPPVLSARLSQLARAHARGPSARHCRWARSSWSGRTGFGFHLVAPEPDQPGHQSIRILIVFLFFNCLDADGDILVDRRGNGRLPGRLRLGSGGAAVAIPAGLCFAAATVVYLLVYEGLWHRWRGFPGAWNIRSQTWAIIRS